mgnify:CR=1 FL=1
MSAIGLRVGPFEIVSEMEVPEAGLWHLGTRTGMTRRQPHDVLVRLLPSDATPDERQALHRQFEVLKTLDDPRVPEAVAFYEGLGALALAYVHGIPLSAIVQQRRDDVVAMSPATLLDIVLEVAETLQRVHHRNRCHGDLSPDRILLGPDGKVWIFGFGEPPGTQPQPRWLAPERANDEDPTALTDQWYLGVLAACLVTGQTPFESGADARRGDLDPVLSKVDRQWPALGRLLRQMTEPRPENRFPSMHPVRQELLALARKAGGTSERRDLGASLCPPRPTTPAPRDPTPSPPPAAADAPVEPSEPDTAELPSDAAPAEAAEPEPEPALAVDPPSDPRGDGFAPVTEELPPLPEADSLTDDDPELTLDDVLTPRPVPRRQALPDEAFPVVRPDVSDDLPTAGLGGLGASLDDLKPAHSPSALDAGAEVGFSPRFEGALADDETPLSDSDEGATVLYHSEDFNNFVAGLLSEDDDASDPGDEEPAVRAGLSADTAVPVTDSGEGGSDFVDEEETEPSVEVSSHSFPYDDTSEEVTDPVFLSREHLDLDALSNAPSPDVVTTQPLQASASSPDFVRKLAPALVAVFLMAFMAWLITQALG